MGGEPAITTGTGRIEMDKPTSDYLLRQAQFTTVSSEECANLKLGEDNPDTVICAYEAPAGGQAAFKGDSGRIFDQVLTFLKEFEWYFQQSLFYSQGGPLLSKNDGKLIGVMSSYIKFDRDYQSILQIFMNIPYYYEWIERITGLEIPKCTA